MYSILKHLHSATRWLVLFGLVWAIVHAYSNWKKSAAFNKDTRRPSFLAFNFTHLQATLGIIIYFVTPRIVFGPSLMKDGIMRFFALEHPLMMLIAIVLITMGYIKGKKGLPGTSFKTIFWYYLIALVLILATIPWPWMKYATAWI
ncbi:MAG: cytochrome B [Saprospiraceae bacterium]